ncbi:MAG: beta-lactamase family protein [Oscillospiraceae bacterium]|nr:beta-lactamase family protein [Oscillospiraceae bacterium]
MAAVKQKEKDAARKPKGQALPRAKTPEEAGISSLRLADWIRDLLQSNIEVHSLMVLRGGKVAFEAFRAPFTPKTPHMLFSVSKAVTSTAVGLAAAEGLLTLEDRVIDLLPAYAPETPDETLEKLTVRHLLTMTAGKQMSMTADKSKNRWAEDFFEGKWEYAPGEGWSYTNENIYMLSLILRRLTGQSMVDYLMPRLFEPLGIARPTWETDGGGVEAGGWGLSMTTEDFAKYMLLYQQKGMWQGQRILPAEWVEASTTWQADNHKSEEDGNSGYGYCFWLNELPNSYRADGFFSQLGYVYGDDDAVVVINAAEPMSHKVKECFARHFPGIFIEPGSEPPVAEVFRQSRLTLPALPELYETPRSKMIEHRIEGRLIAFSQRSQFVNDVFGYPVSVMPLAVFYMSANKAGHINFVRFRFQADTCKFSWSEGAERNTVLCGMDGKARQCKIRLGGVDFVVACTAAWEGGSKLHVWIRPMGHVAQRRLVFTFGSDTVRMLPRSSPSLAAVAQYISGNASNLFHNPLVIRLAEVSMSKVALVAEPLHFGYFLTK